jgi:hypothetical protein
MTPASQMSFDNGQNRVTISIMMGNWTKSIRCSVNKCLPFAALERELETQLEMNAMSGVVKIARGENDRTFKLTSHNYGLGGVKHTFQMICDKVDSDEAKARGDWTAHYPPVETQWFEVRDLTRELERLKAQKKIDQEALDRAHARARPGTPGSQQWVGSLTEDMRKLDKRIAELEDEIGNTLT